MYTMRRDFRLMLMPQEISESSSPPMRDPIYLWPIAISTTLLRTRVSKKCWRILEREAQYLGTIRRGARGD